MSNSMEPLSGSAQESDVSPLEKRVIGQIGEKRIVRATCQTSKGWFAVAIIVGSLVVIGVGGFGSMGLLHSQDLFSLPHRLTAAIGTVGHTPHLWSLWAVTVGGVVIGGGLIAFGSCKIHQARMADKQLEPEKPEELKEPEKPEDLSQPKTSEEPESEKDLGFLESAFSQKFDSLGIDSNNYERLSSSTYTVQYFNEWNASSGKYSICTRNTSQELESIDSKHFTSRQHFIVLKDANNELFCTDTITVQTAYEITNLLKTNAFCQEMR